MTMDYPLKDYEDSFLNFHYDYGNEVCEKSEEKEIGSNALLFIFSIVITLSLIGNILVILISALYESMNCLTNIFIFNLAISDLVFTVGLPFWAINPVRGLVFPDIVCKTLTLVFFIGFYSNIFFLTTMTIYKCLVEVHYQFDKSSLIPWHGVFLSFSIWMICIIPARLHASLSIYSRGTHPKDSESNSFNGEIINISMLNFIFFVDFALIVFCYIYMLIRTKRTRSNTMNQAVIQVFCTVVVFFLGWIPYNLLNILGFLAGSWVELSKVSFQLDFAFQVSRQLAFATCCLKPVVYALLNEKFRRNLSSLLLKLCRRQSLVNKEEVRMQNPFPQPQ